jgi:hypothetical protein
MEPEILLRSDQMKNNKMGGTCGTRGGEERCRQGFVRDTGNKETTYMM